LRLFGRIRHGGNETRVVEAVASHGECRRVSQTLDFGYCRRVLAGDDCLNWFVLSFLTLNSRVSVADDRLSLIGVYYIVSRVQS